MTKWLLRDFKIGDIPCKLIEFSIYGNEYMMLFSRPNAIRTPELLGDKEVELGVALRENSFEVKFDLRCNFESDNFFVPPEIATDVKSIKELGKTVVELLYFHYSNSDAEIYFCVASTHKLKRFYDRLANKYAAELNFEVINGLGEEGLGYEIKTPSYKSSAG